MDVWEKAALPRAELYIIGLELGWAISERNGFHLHDHILQIGYKKTLNCSLHSKRILIRDYLL